MSVTSLARVSFVRQARAGGGRVLHVPRHIAGGGQDGATGVRASRTVEARIQGRRTRVWAADAATSSTVYGMGMRSATRQHSTWSA